jgi:glycosyltransferase involved in cell wall biosynthesis
MIVCYLGPFNPDSPRNRVIVKGLLKNDVKLIQCNAVSHNQVVNCLKLLKNLKMDYDIMMLGARGDYYGQPLVPIVKSITRKPVVFDAMITLYETEVVDRKIVNAHSLKAQFWYLLDYAALHKADLVLTDTLVHARRYSYDYRVGLEKFRQVPIGSDDDVFYPRETKVASDVFCVMFWGSFVPLQGVKYILEAAKLLEQYSDIKFELRGFGQTYLENLMLAKKLDLKNVIFNCSWIPYDDFPNCIAKADLCLGIFGETEKAKLVIPTKAVDTLAMQKPLITGDSIAAREVLSHGENSFLVPMCSPHAIAEAIFILKQDKQLRNKIALNGNRLFTEKFSPKAIGKNLKFELEQLVEQRK